MHGQSVCVKIKRAIGEMAEDAAAEVNKEVQHIAYKKARAQLPGDVSIGTSDKAGAMLF
jgi:hypothetical protein